MIATRRSWGNYKPPLGVRVMEGHELAPDFGWLMNEGGGPTLVDLSARRNGTFNSTNVTRVGTRRGLGIRTLGTAADFVSFGDSSLILPTSGGFTAVLHYRKLAPTTFTASSGWGISAETVDKRCQAHLPFSDGTVYWDYGGATENSTRESVAGLSFGDDIWAFTTGARGMEIWQNGILRSSNSANPTRNASTQLLRLFAGQSDPDTSDVESAFFYVYRMQLAAGQIMWLHAEPSAFLAPPAPYRRYFHGAAGAAGGKLLNRLHTEGLFVGGHAA